MIRRLKQIENKKFKLWGMSERMIKYVSLINFVMLIILLILQTNINPILLILLLLFGGIGLAIFDWKMVFSKELETRAKKNPVTMGIVKDLKLIKKALGVKK